MDSCERFHPEFVHQHFGEKETIFGYENLDICINYSNPSMYIYPEISYTKEISSIEKDMKGDDIMTKLKEQLPMYQMDTMVESKEAFEFHLAKQSNFKPFGMLIAKFSSGDTTFELYKITESSPEFDDFLARVQTLALWFIDAAQFTDNTDPRWMHYFLFESRPHTSGDGSRAYSLAGYVSLYRFYSYPERERPRVAQIMLLPQYRKGGNGAKLLQCVYRDLYTINSVYDITAEDPADNFIYLRDYVDCVNCSSLPEFSTENLRKGFSDEMRYAALHKLKINKRQCRRVYEILRLKATNLKDKDELKAYRVDVKRRLEAPLKRNDRDWKKINRALDQDEIAQVAATQLNADQKMQHLQQLYETEIEGYKVTINRINTFSKIF